MGLSLIKGGFPIIMTCYEPNSISTNEQVNILMNKKEKQGAHASLHDCHFREIRPFILNPTLLRVYCSFKCIPLAHRTSS